MRRALINLVRLFSKIFLSKIFSLKKRRRREKLGKRKSGPGLLTKHPLKIMHKLRSHFSYLVEKK
jgi:hypothetical protein